MGCSKCEYLSQTNVYCPDAYTEKSHLCGNYDKEDNYTDYDSLEEKHLGNPEDKTGIYANYDEPNTINMSDIER